MVVLQRRLTSFAGTPFKRVDESEWVGSQFHVTKDNSYFALGLDQSECVRVLCARVTFFLVVAFAFGRTVFFVFRVSFFLGTAPKRPRSWQLSGARTFGTRRPSASVLTSAAK